MNDQIKKAMETHFTQANGYNGINKALELTKTYAGTPGAVADAIPRLFMDLADLFVLMKDPRD